MKITFKEPDIQIPITKVELLWGGDKLPSVLLKKNTLTGEWGADLPDLPPGEHGYRFLINDRFTLNNPEANMYRLGTSNMLWSILFIDSNGEQLFNTEQYEVHLESVCMNDDYYRDEREPQSEFHTDKDKQAVIRYEFTKVTGAHTVSVLWMSPDNTVTAWAEEILAEPNTIWFGLDFTSLTDISSGTWSVNLFIDGAFVLRNDFNVKYVPPRVQSINVTV